MEENLKNIKPEIRYLQDLREVLYDQEWLKTAPNFEVYYIYRGIKKEGELRYDITVVPAKMLGQEFVKTKGHQHLGKYSEVYIVLEGRAFFLMQKVREEKVEDIYAVEAKKGEAVIVPSFYGHVTINSTPEELKMANWVSENCKSDYQLFEKMRGACYYYIQKGWIKNNNYKNIPELRFEKPLKSLPENLDFLKG